MAVVAVGIHERNAPLELFEKVAVSERDMTKALSQLTDSPQLSEAVIVSTCMRTEIYAVVERFHDGLADIESWLRERLGDQLMGPDRLGSGGIQHPEPGGGTLELGGRFVCWYEEAAVSHLFEVAAGIDSPVLGEGEILRQVKDAAEHARAEGAAGTVLAPLFRHALEAGKRARSETAIQRGTTSLAHAVVEVAADHALGLEGQRVLIVGAGEMATGIARALSGRRDLTGEVVVLNRGGDRGRSVADIVAGRSGNLEALSSELATSDVAFVSTSAGETLIDTAMLAPLMKERGGRRLVLLDAAVPRNIDPEVAGLDGVVLADIEEVRRHAEEQMAGRLGEIPAVKSILAEEIERYRTTVAGRMAAPVVSALRQRAEELRATELARHERRLETLDPAERELVEMITRRVVAKLLHEPTVRVKDAAGSPRGERLAEALRSLFDL